MVGWAFLIICLLAALVVGGKYLLEADPQKLARGLRYIILALTLSAGLFFLATGRFAVGLGVLLFSFPYAKRLLFPGWAGLSGMFKFPNWSRAGGSGGGKSSEVETAFLKMTLSHDRGEMDGQVLQGTFAGKSLRDLSQTQLLAFYETCLLEDPESATLMEAYLDRAFGPSWRNDAGAPHDGPSAGKRRGWGKSGNSQMTTTEAREILGVSDGASETEIKEAHRRLMLKNHPDRGGSDLLATKINQAKDLLLGL